VGGYSEEERRPRLGGFLSYSAGHPEGGPPRSLDHPRRTLDSPLLDTCHG
jgi:hypothetical protein